MAKPLYPKGKAPPMDVPPHNRNLGGAHNVIKKDVTGIPADWLEQDPVKPGTIYHTSAVQGKSHRTLMANISDNNPLDAPKITRQAKVNSQTMHLNDLSEQKMRLGKMAADEYKATGKTGGPMSSVAASSIKRLTRRQNKIKDTMANPLDIAAASARQKGRRMYEQEKMSKGATARAGDLIRAGANIEIANKVDGNSTAGLKLGSPFYNHAVDKIGRVGKQFLGTVGVFGKLFGAVGDIGMAAEAANALVPIRAKSPEMKSLDVLRTAVFDKDGKTRTY